MRSRGTGVGVVGLFALLVVGRLFADLTTLNAALLFAAPLLGWLPELLPARRGVRVALRLGLAAVPVVVALVLAQAAFWALCVPRSDPMPDKSPIGSAFAAVTRTRVVPSANTPSESSGPVVMRSTVSPAAVLRSAMDRPG